MKKRFASLVVFCLVGSGSLYASSPHPLWDPAVSEQLEKEGKLNELNDLYYEQYDMVGRNFNLPGRTISINPSIEELSKGKITTEEKRRYLIRFADALFKRGNWYFGEWLWKLHDPRFTVVEDLGTVRSNDKAIWYLLTECKRKSELGKWDPGLCINDESTNVYIKTGYTEDEIKRGIDNVFNK